jgi:DNA modification methylase
MTGKTKAVDQLSDPVLCPVCGHRWDVQTPVSWWLNYDRCYSCMGDAAAPAKGRLPTVEEMEPFRHDGPPPPVVTVPWSFECPCGQTHITRCPASWDDRERDLWTMCPTLDQTVHVQIRPIPGVELPAAAESPAESYEEFIARKVDFQRTFGFDVADDDVHPILLPHQRDVVRWAVLGGRRAIFAAFGLGKSVMQLETVRLAREQYSIENGPGRALIVCPLGVRQEFRRDAEMLGIPTRFVRRTDELDPVDVDDATIYLTNYESIRDGRLDPTEFVCISLDEAAVLRGFGTKTFHEFTRLMANVPLRYVATATPSPNRYKELIHYAGFLGIMDTGQALTRFFKRDSTKANKLTLHPHKEQEFWLWLASWSVFLQRPSDLGYSDDGYDLPEMELVFHEIEIDALANLSFETQGQGVLVRDPDGLGVIGASKEKRSTLDARIAMAAEIVAGSPDDHFILWHDLEDERRSLKRAIPEAVEVFGSQDLDEREQRIIDFSEGRSRILATKPVLSGSGCNFQRHCHRAVFVGVGFKFNDFIQAVHRIHRFMQTERVRIDIIHADTERGVVASLMRKWEQHKELTATMSDLIQQHGLSQQALTAALERGIGVDRVEAAGVGWTAVNNDCVKEAQRLATDSVGLVVTSIPFSNHYEYSPNYNDFGHTDNNDHFWAQMDYLTGELLRVLAPGRLYCCHVKDRVLFGNVTGKGTGTISPFHAEAIMHGIRHGFDYMGMITVVTDVVRENNQTYRLGWTKVKKDATSMGVGSPEYILLFRKPQTDRSAGWADTPVTHTTDDYSLARWQIDAHAFWRSNGNRPITGADLEGLPVPAVHRMFAEATANGIYDWEAHVSIGDDFAGRGRLPTTFMLLAPGSSDPDVWSDVNRMLTLNTTQAQKGMEQHICPLQFDIVDRLITRFSNPDDLVFDPFGGLMTVPNRAIRLGRRGYASELNPTYWADGVKHLQAAERQLNMPSLFDLLDATAEVLDTDPAAAS